MWLTDPELFLYSKVGGDDVQVWRCKKTMKNSTPVVVPMVPDDFEYVSQVEDHSDLVDGNILDWEETDYKALVKYISERRLLVNGQGLVIAELSKFSEDEDDDQSTDADILPIYLRSLDILSLKDYIPKLRERPIPSRKVQYLEDVNGKAAPVEGGDSTTTTKELVAELQEDLKRERSEKLGLAKRFADAEVEIKTLEAKNVKLNTATDDQEERIKKLNQEMVGWRDRAGYLESTNKTQEERIRRLNADLDRANQESWRNDIHVPNKWLEAGALRNLNWTNNITILRGQGTYTVDDNNSNVRASYWSQVRLGDNVQPFKGVAIRDLAPNREKARFRDSISFNVNTNEGILYVLCKE